MAALKEAIQIAQETNDHVCLEHCLVSLCYNKALVTEHNFIGKAIITAANNSISLLLIQ